MKKGNLRVGLLGAALLATCSCATVIRGTEQSLQIMSDPPGARASLGTGQACNTPCSINLSRSTSTAITFEKEGCERTMVSVFPTIAGAGVVLGGVIDYGTGAVYNLQPNPVVASLRCGQTGASVAPTVTTTTPVAVSAPAPSSTSHLATPNPSGSLHDPTQNVTSAADTQMRNLDREFKAGKISLEEYRKIKKVLQGGE